jgi:mannose-6-phosphate isomerase-like protein (cupin superfamily)
VTLAEIDDMEEFYGGAARRVRAALGVTAWGMQVMTLPAHGESYTHSHGPESPEAGQEEVYVPLAGSAELVSGEERFALQPGVMVRVGPAVERRVVAGGEGFRFLAIGGVPGQAYSPLPWTELGGPVPEPAGAS